uniref:NADH dehydrogenase subunit 6 n=1 Tax=Lineus viridis TaxID=56195 RepID=C6GCS8_9BILA|nr:NADH dehydrogenase subunit 6 [Lineus viridis]ACO40319.1 NADH dehydrogenase subunit 6 [Lineus viridis]
MFLAFFVGSILGLVFIVPLMQQGVSLIAVIFFLSVVISLIVGLLGYVWYGFSLFLIYVGSLLVMFGYVVAMVPNFLLKQSSLVFFVFSGFFLGGFFFFKTVSVEGNFDVGSFIYSSSGCLILIGLAFVLLFSLVCVVKVCYFSSGSLRPFSL